MLVSKSESCYLNLTWTLTWMVERYDDDDVGGDVDVDEDDGLAEGLT